MFWKIEKMAARVREIKKFRYRDFQPIQEFHSYEDLDGNPGGRPNFGDEWEIVRLGDNWTGRDLYLWLETIIKLPNEWEGKKIVGVFDFGRTGGGNNSGFESLAYVNGIPYQGVDSNHTEIFFEPNLLGTNVTLQFRLWSGLEGGGPATPQEHKVKTAGIGWLDEATDNLYFMASAALQTIQVLPEESTERISLTKALDNALLQIDWSYPGSDMFYESVNIARQLLENKFDGMDKHSDVTIHCLGHTHIDVAWLWRLKHTREKAARSFSTVLRLMKMYPEFTFLQSQPQLYDYIKKDYPELYIEIRERVTERRWETDGAMWLEADCNLTSGESLVRQILMGTRFFREEFGTVCKYLWLPDVFGYSWALPQILAKSGIHTFMTTKISWNEYNHMPHDTFKWRGLDGSEVLTHFITTPSGSDEPYYTYNGLVEAETIRGIWEGYKDKAINQDLLLAFGYGDGGGGVNRDMLEMRKYLDKMPGLPNVKLGRADEYFESLHKTIKETEEFVHTWDGELYLEYHRGTYTSQAYNKRMNRRLELYYREAEWMSVLESILVTGWDHYPQRKLNDGWKIILRNQFHDIIPGSSIHEVYEDSRHEYQDAEQIAKKIWTSTSESLVCNESTSIFTVFNSSSLERKDLVKVPFMPGTETGEWFSPQGEMLKSQRSETEWLVEIPTIPPMGFCSIEFHHSESKEDVISSPFITTASGIITPFYEIEWNEKGQLLKLYDKEMNREVLAEGEIGNVIQVFEDKPIMYNAWNIDIFYQEKMKEVTELIDTEIVEVGNLQSIIRFEWRYQSSTILQYMVVYADNRRIDFRTTVDWHEHEQLMKVAFPVDIRATEATYDIQYGNVKRPTHWNTSWDLARFESVAHQWVDLSEQGYGVSLLNDCKYGHDIKDHTIRLSLIKSAINPDTDADQGLHEFTYALLPHTGSWFEGNSVLEAWKLNNPLRVSVGRGLMNEFSLFHISAPNVFIDSVKKAEDSNQIILRVHEFTGGRAHVVVESDLSIEKWQECNLVEKVIGDVHQSMPLSFDLKPYEIKTYLVDVKQSVC